MNGGTRIWAVVPVKRFTVAKSRLSPVFDRKQRAELAQAMYEDVLDALLSCDRVLAGTIVVTSDESAIQTAHMRGVAVSSEGAEDGINAAVGRAIGGPRWPSNAGAIIVPSDIPQLTRTAIVQAAAALSAPCTIAIAAAARDGGTNLLGGRPASTMSLSFGPHSFERHCRAAAGTGLTIRVLQAPELSLDIDRPEDIGAFLSLKTSTRTHAFLSRICIAPYAYAAPAGQTVGRGAGVRPDYAS